MQFVLTIDSWSLFLGIPESSALILFRLCLIFLCYLSNLSQIPQLLLTQLKNQKLLSTYPQVLKTLPSYYRGTGFHVFKSNLSICFQTPILSRFLGGSHTFNHLLITFTLSVSKGSFSIIMTSVHILKKKVKISPSLYIPFEILFHFSSSIQGKCFRHCAYFFPFQMSPLLLAVSSMRKAVS